MASMKAKKGNPFEYDCMFSLIKGGFKVKRPDSNEKGVDLIAGKLSHTFYIECKNHKGFTWNKIKQILEKTDKTVRHLYLATSRSIVILKAVRQPILVAYYDINKNIVVKEFDTFFFNHGAKFETRPKGLSLTKMLTDNDITIRG